MKQFCLAYRKDRTLNIRYSEEWCMSIFNYLTDLGYKLVVSSEQHWNKQIDEFGNPTLTYDLDENDLNFDVGE